MDVEATRKAMKLSRKQLAQKAGVTESAVWSVEHGKNPHGGEEVRQKVLAALDPLAAGSDQVETPFSTSEPRAKVSTGQPPGPRGGKKIAALEDRPDWTRRYEWLGMVNGDQCRVQGEGTGTFFEHVTTDLGNTHVTVFLDGKWRFFAPDRVTPAVASRKRRGPGEGTNGKTDWTLEVTTPSGEVHTSTFAHYVDARTQMLRYEVPGGGKCKIRNYLGTVVEAAPKGWAADEVSAPKVVTV